MRAHLHYWDGRVVLVDVGEFRPTLSHVMFHGQCIRVDAPLPELRDIQATTFQIDARASRETGVGIYKEI